MPVMSEHILKVKLSELTRIRLVCPACGFAQEADIAELIRLAKLHPDDNCPVCHRDWRIKGPDGNKANSLDKLSRILQSIVASDGMSVEFVLPDPRP